MPYVVTLVQNGGIPINTVRTFGPFDSEDDAEQARRRIHFDNGRGYFNRNRTFVSPMESEDR